MLKEMQKRINLEPFDAIILSGLENPVAAMNLRYATGYTGTFGVAIIGENYKYFITDFRYRDQVALEAPEFTYVELKKTLVHTIKSVIKKENIKSLGFDRKILVAEFETYQNFEVELIPLLNFVESYRVSKTQEEVAKIKKACEITDQALAESLKELKAGVTEREMEIKLKTRMIELGADKTWDRFIVASGPRGAMPHGNASSKVIEEGEMVTFDIGCSYKGYYSDLTRTVSVGEPSAKMKEIYDIVYEAQRRGVEAAKAGITGKELDNVTRNYITEKGYGDYYKHGTGHGLGLDIHEGPRVSQANSKPLELGACITIEPGIYISGLGGVRIEDDIILTEDGCIVLNESPRELIIIK